MVSFASVEFLPIDHLTFSDPYRPNEPCL